MGNAGVVIKEFDSDSDNVDVEKSPMSAHNIDNQ